MTIFPTFSDNNYRNLLFIMSAYTIDFSVLFKISYQKYDIKFFGRQNGTGNFEFSTKEFTENYRYLDDLGSLDQILTTTPPYLIHIKNIIFGRPLKLKLEIANFQFIFDEYKKNTDKESGESIDDLDRSDFRPRFSSNVSS